MTLPLLNVSTWATYIKWQLYLSERKEKDRDRERHATFLPGSQVSTHFYQYSAADLPDALKIPLVPSCIFCDAVFSNFCVFCGKWHTPTVLLGSTGCQRYFVHLDRVICPGNNFNQTETSVGVWHPNNLHLLPLNVEVIVSFQSSPQHQLRLGPDTLVLLPPHLCFVSLPLP